MPPLVLYIIVLVVYMLCVYFWDDLLDFASLILNVLTFYANLNPQKFPQFYYQQKWSLIGS